MYIVHCEKTTFVFMKTNWVHYFLQPFLIWLQKVDPKYKYLHRCRSLDWHIFWQVYDYFPPLSWFAHLCIVPFSKAHSALSKREKLSSLCISFKKCIDGEREIKVEWMFILFTPYRDAKCKMGSNYLWIRIEIFFSFIYCRFLYFFQFEFELCMY